MDRCPTRQRMHLPRAPRAGSRAGLAAAASLATLLLAACAVPVTRTTHIYEAPEPAAAFGDVEYGTVRRIDVTDTTERPTGGGALLGGLIGGVLGNQIGHGAGRAAATVLGAFGGGALGNEIERDQADAMSSRVYHVVVHFDHGDMRSFDYRGLNGLRVGDRVRLEHGILERG